MTTDIFLLDIPNFIPQYKKDTLYSYEGKGKGNLKEVLTEASNGYCMYCYTKILIDRKNFGVLEHSIEKFNCDKLKNCPSNISIACSVCNGSFKRKGEKIRALTVEEVRKFEISSECGVTCIESCSKYNDIRRSYTAKEGGQIILQTFGIKNKITGREYLIQYDLLNQKFAPSNSYEYNNEEKQFIESHINRFNLNDSKYRTKEFSKFLEDVIEYKSIPKKNRYCNLVVDLFIEKIKDSLLDIIKRFYFIQEDSKKNKRAIFPRYHQLDAVRKIVADLANAITSGVKIIITTIQKFPYALEKIKDLEKRKYAVIIDEAHSSTAGDNMSALKETLAGKTLEEAAKELGSISESPKGWKKELNLISWNGKEAKYDLRDKPARTQDSAYRFSRTKMIETSRFYLDVFLFCITIITWSSKIVI